MTRRLPESEPEWLEALSAYMDGELPPDEAMQIEMACRNDPARLRQLESLRATRTLLREWSPAAPEPPVEFLASLGGVRRTQIRPRAKYSLWLSYAAVALMGAAIGALGARSIPSTNPTQVTTAHEPGHAPTEILPVSSDRTESLLREVRADALRGQLLSSMSERNWAEAASIYDDLTMDWADTESGAQVRVDPAFQAVRQWRVLHRST